MTHASKQAQLKSRQDNLRDEVHLFIVKGDREGAIRHYQQKCACSVTRASEYVDALNREWQARRRVDFLMKNMRRHAFA